MSLLAKTRLWAVTITSCSSDAVFLGVTSSILTSLQLIGTRLKTHWTKLIRAVSRLVATFSSKHCRRSRRNSTRAETALDYSRSTKLSVCGRRIMGVSARYRRFEEILIVDPVGEAMLLIQQKQPVTLPAL